MKAFVLFLLLSAASYAQDSVARLVNPDGSSGSCVLLEKTNQLEDGWIGLAVTASHVVKGVATFRVEYNTGRKSGGCFTLVDNKEADLAIIRVWAPDDVEPAQLHEGDIQGEVVFIGYPSEGRGRTAGRFLRLLDKNVFSDAVLRPGYSGGGAFSGGKLVGCISGGWLWLREENRQVTWPARAGSYAEIARMLEEARRRD